MVSEWLQLNDIVIGTLDNMKYPIINVVDVGVNQGQMKQFLDIVLKTPSFFVGIEPNTELIQTNKYDVMFDYAIDDVESPEKRTFYINEDSDCSSLLKMKDDIITHDINERNNEDKWYIPRNINNIRESKEVTVTSLKNVLDTIPKFQTELIHLLKVDVQGVDIRVIKSMKEYLDNTIFVMVEIVTSKNKDVVLYEGQTAIEDDVKTMDELGFSPYHIIDYAPTPEADIIFINKKYINE
jgi:FkbM family methyltransferase